MTDTCGERTSHRDPDALRRRAGVYGDPSQDQHFLVDDRVLDRIPTYAAAFDQSHVLEVGAGNGALTDRLLCSAETVTAIERDPTLAAFLRDEFRSEIDAGHLRIREGDALEVDLPEFSASVSNLPYGVASQVLFRLLPRRQPLLVMVQREFGERMAAKPGTEAYGRLSVTASHYGSVEIVEPVPKEAFDPVPAVDSALVRITPREPTYDVSEDIFLRVVKAVFTQRRKTLRNAIRNTTHISGISDPAGVLDGLDSELLGARPETLTPTDFATIATIAEQREGDHA